VSAESLKDVDDLLHWGALELKGVSKDRALYEARLLLAKVTGLSEVDLIAKPHWKVGSGEERLYRDLVKKRQALSPIAYLLGRREFCGHTFEVNEATLIPRPETEELVLESTRWLRAQGFESANVLDLGTGSGCIALSLAMEFRDENFQFVGLDVSQAALQIARKNRDLLGARSVEFVHEDIFAPKKIWQGFDLIVSNPPYLSQLEYETLDLGIKNYEPPESLVSGKAGLAHYDAIRRLWVSALKRPGLMALETSDASQRARLIEDFKVENPARVWEHECHLFMEWR